MKINCFCKQPFEPYSYICNEDTWKKIVDSFLSLRDQCPALREIVFPDDIWNEVKNSFFSIEFGKASSQCSMFLTAYKRGFLHKLTCPLHEFLLEENGTVRKDISDNYRQPLKENWLNVKKNNSQPIEMERHNKAKKYSGKLIELLFAYKLKVEEYEIKDLEAWENSNNKKADILAHYKKQDYQIEVKYIGQDDKDFKQIFLEEKGGNSDPQQYVNYILFQICKASEQLTPKNLEGNKIAVIIVEPFTMYFSEIELPNFDLKNPTFPRHEKLEADILKSRESKEEKEKIKNIFSNPKKYVENLDGVWIFLFDTSENYDFKLKKQHGLPYQ